MGKQNLTEINNELKRMLVYWSRIHNRNDRGITQSKEDRLDRNMGKSCEINIVDNNIEGENND